MPTRTRKNKYSLITYLDSHQGALYCVLLAISFVLLILFQASTTPLYEKYGGDASIFSIFGERWVDGVIPYRDLYDHKGPIIFLINAISSLFGDDRWALFIMETLAYSLDLLLIYKISRYLVKPISAWSIAVLFTAFFFATSSGGNCVEEWSLPVDLLMVYLAMHFLKTRKPLVNHPHGYSLIYGIGLGYQLMMRFTNAATIGGIILGFVILFVSEKEWKTLFQNAVYVLMGTAVVIIPFVVYFYHHDCLYEMFYDSYVVNFLYANNGIKQNTFHNMLIGCWRSLLVFSGSFLLIILYKLKRISRNLLILICSISFASTGVVLVSNRYLHYWLLGGAAMVLSLCGCFMMGAYVKTLKRHVFCSIALVGVVTLSFIPFMQNLYYAGTMALYTGANLVPKSVLTAEKNQNSVLIQKLKQWREPDYSSYKDISANIVSENYDSVFAYDVHASFYKVTGIPPYKGCKYFIMQPFHAKSDPQINEQILDMMIENPPQYIVMTSQEEAEKSILAKDIANHYALIMDASGYPQYPLILYQRVGE